MKCPYCSGTFTGQRQYCPFCRQPLSRAEEKKAPIPEEAAPRFRLPHIPFAAIGRACFALVMIFLSILGVYKGYYRIVDWRIERLYTKGIYTPTINPVTMADSRPGHSIAFYGEDGDQIYIPELDCSLSISGGVARMEVADAQWFEDEVEQYDAAEVVLSPVLIDEKGVTTMLPAMHFTVDVPSAPLEVLKPVKNNQNILTSRYDLEMVVVPGSTVFINGEDVSAKVNRLGELKQAVKVNPIGTNTYSVVVRTDQHRETRADIELYRQAYDIEIELDDSMSESSNNPMTAVTGKMELGAELSIETPYLEESLEIDPFTGKFSFIAKLSSFGPNIIRFRATKEGKSDAVLSTSINYVPTLQAYAATAWKMDYAQLCDMYEQWKGKVFKLDGKIVTNFIDGTTTYYVMDVSGDGSGQYILITNESSSKNVRTGLKFTGYGDVIGRGMYNAKYCPLLAARYLSLVD